MSTVEQLAQSTSVDPTQTSTLRGKLAGRWRSAYGRINTQLETDIVDRDVFGLRGQEQLAPSNEPNTGQDYDASQLPPLAGLTISQQVDRFREWFNRQQERGIRGRLSRTHNPYLTEAYGAGLRRSETALRAAGYNIDSLDPSDMPSRRKTLDNARGRFTNRLTKAFQDTTAEVGQELREGLNQELAATALVTRLKDRINHSRAGKTRARPVAHSSIVLLVNEVALSRYRLAGVENVGAQVERRVTVAGPMTDLPEEAARGVPGSDEKVQWQTADANACQQCLSLEGRTWPISAFNTGDALMPVRDTHPSCRCFLVPT